MVYILGQNRNFIDSISKNSKETRSLDNGLFFGQLLEFLFEITREAQLSGLNVVTILEIKALVCIHLTSFTNDSDGLCEAKTISKNQWTVRDYVSLKGTHVLFKHRNDNQELLEMDNFIIVYFLYANCILIAKFLKYLLVIFYPNWFVPLF